jgi:acetoin utilization protein AcuB
MMVVHPFHGKRETGRCAMKTRDLMIPDPITISETATIQDAIELMKVNSIRHLPVVGPGDDLRGFVTLADLKQGLIPSMLGDLDLRDLIIRQPVTVGPDDDIEVAAQKIYKHKIGGMPVVAHNRLVGILTETDILRAFIHMMGFLTASSRVEVAMKADRDDLQKALGVISDAGGEVINVAMTAQQKKKICYFRLTPCRTGPIQRALEAAGFEVLEATD